MEKIILAKLNILEKFENNVRNLIKFENNSISKIINRLNKLNHKINCPKWSIEIIKQDQVYYLHLVGRKNISTDILSQNAHIDCNHEYLTYQVSERIYMITNSLIQKKIQNNKLRCIDIDKYLDKNFRKIKSSAKQIAREYGFELIAKKHQETTP
jgi:hypothetical protein